MTEVVVAALEHERVEQTPLLTYLVANAERVRNGTAEPYGASRLPGEEAG